MKRRVLLPGFAIALGLTSLLVLLSIFVHQAKAIGLAPLNAFWRQANTDGFGEAQNGQIPSLAVFGEYLYAGVWHSDNGTETAQIWRSSNGADWQKVNTRSANGAAHLIAFKGSLYSGSWDGQIWRSSNGVNWSDVIVDGFSHSNIGIARFAVFDNMLYASTWYTGTQVWRSLDGTEWEKFGSDGFDNNPNNTGAIASEVFNNNLYYGVMNFNTGAELWRTDGIKWTSVVKNGFGNKENSAISSLAVFNGSLYAGVWNSNGVQVWRSSNGLDWTNVAADGIGNPNAANNNALEVFNGRLYMVVRNAETGLEVWRTSDGTQWEQVGFEGFGDENNQWSFFDNATTVFKEKLYVGTNNFATGGEIWEMSDKVLFLPIVRR